MKTILVTGSTDGIGLETAKALAGMGHHVLLHGRNSERLARAKQSILKAFPSAQLDLFLADFASLTDVRRLAFDIKNKVEKLDVLINNAGVYMKERVLSRDGYEMTFAVNQIAPFVLTLNLLDLLKKSSDPRVVNVSSIAHTRGHLDFKNLNGEKSFSAYEAYANSKLANILFTRELSRREPWLSSNSLHPGVITTKLLKAGFDMTGASVQEGAKTSIYLATAENLKGVSGKYFVDCKEKNPSPEALDNNIAKQLWELLPIS